MSLAMLWAVAAVALVMVEMFTMEFTCLSIAIGCSLAAGAAWGGMPIVVQLAVAVIGSGLGMFLLAPYLRGRLAPKDVATGVDALPGTEAVVVEAISPDGQGKVKLHGVVWQAEAAQAIPAGATVVVTAVEGACLRVLSTGPLLAPEQKLPGTSPQRDMLGH